MKALIFSVLMTVIVTQAHASTCNEKSAAKMNPTPSYTSLLPAKDQQQQKQQPIKSNQSAGVTAKSTT